MGFEARITLLENSPPVRVYLHTAGLNEVYGENDMGIVNAYSRLQHVIENGLTCSDLNQYNLLLASMWGDISQGRKDIMIDFFGYKGLNKNWQTNPEIYIWTTRNEELDITSTCGESLIIFGKEEERRRESRSMELYLRNKPKDLGILKPKSDIVILRQEIYRMPF